MKTIHQYGRVYSEIPERIRLASRAFLISDGKILLSHELNTGVYLIPGGGAEDNESAEECCVREIEEETGSRVVSKSNSLNYQYIDEKILIGTE